MLASVVTHFAKAQGDAGLQRARALFPRIFKWHKWWHDARTPDGVGVVCTVHPWETGRDNCPDWKIGLRNMQIDPELEPYQRKRYSTCQPY